MVNLNELKAQMANENVVLNNSLHTLYEKMQDRLAVDLKNARDANEDPNAKIEASEGTWHQLSNAPPTRKQ